MIKDYKDYKLAVVKIEETFLIALFGLMVVALLFALTSSIFDNTSLLQKSPEAPYIFLFLDGILFGEVLVLFASYFGRNKQLNKKYPKFRVQMFEERLKK